MFFINPRTQTTNLCVKPVIQVCYNNQWILIVSVTLFFYKEVADARPQCGEQFQTLGLQEAEN